MHHAFQLRLVEAAVADRRAKLVNTLGLVARSGQRGQTQDRKERIVWAPAFETYHVGTLLKVDPVLGADMQTIDLTVHFEHHLADPEPIALPVVFALGGPRQMIHLTQFHRVVMEQKLTFQEGEVILLAAWSPPTSAAPDDTPRIQMAFLHTHLIPLP